MKHNRKIVMTLMLLVLLAIAMIFLITSLMPKESIEEENNYCSPESRNAEACIEIYQPVCGWFNPEKVQCIKYPCAQTFSNSCFSCMNEDVLYWTEGECPV